MCVSGEASVSSQGGSLGAVVDGADAAHFAEAVALRAPGDERVPAASGLEEAGLGRRTPGEGDDPPALSDLSRAVGVPGLMGTVEGADAQVRDGGRLGL